MNRKKLGIGVIIAALGFAGYKLFSATKKLEFGELKKKGQQIKLDGIHVQLSMSVKNNDKSTSLPFDGFVGGLYYGDTIKLVDITIPKKQTILAKKTIYFDIELKISWLGLGANIVSLIKSGDWLNSAWIVGKIKSGGLTFDQRKKITF